MTATAEQVQEFQSSRVQACAMGPGSGYAQYMVLDHGGSSKEEGR